MYARCSSFGTIICPWCDAVDDVIGWSEFVLDFITEDQGQVIIDGSAKCPKCRNMYEFRLGCLPCVMTRHPQEEKECPPEE